MPLTMLRPGARAEVTAVHGGRGLRQRLASMGIRPDERLTVIKGGFGGPFVVEVGGGRFILGRGMTHKVLVLPLMSCGARLPIYALFIPAFFPETWHAPLLWGIYIIGILLAIVLAKVLRSTIFRGEVAPFVMELPPYRMPTVRGTLIHMWERAWLFLRKAGTIIVGISILLWAMNSYPKPPKSELEGLAKEEVQQAELSYSGSGRLGHALEPLMKPIGFDWKTSTAMVGAFAAKEVFVAQLGIVHAVGEADEESQPLRASLQEEYTPLQAFCIMLFCLVSVPCMVTI